MMRAISWDEMEAEQVNDKITRRRTNGETVTVAKFVISRGGQVPRHSHVNEQVTMILEGALKFAFDDGETVVRPGQVLVIPPHVPHSALALEDTIDIDFFTPRREDWIRKEDSYFRAAEPPARK
jgi:quercetin dioxygenase-like cupin family protein